MPFMIGVSLAENLSADLIADGDTHRPTARAAPHPSAIRCMDTRWLGVCSHSSQLRHEQLSHERARLACQHKA